MDEERKTKRHFVMTAASQLFSDDDDYDSVMVTLSDFYVMEQQK